MTETRWDPAAYAAFGDLRLRPALELLARMVCDAPRAVVDLGCGAGAVGPALKGRWPGARLIGLDPSAAMLAQAEATGVYDATRLEDAAGFAADPGFAAADGPAASQATVDAIYANAALHWAADHRTLLPALMRRLSPGGALGAQMPRMLDAPSHRLLAEVAAGFAATPVAGQPGALAPEAYLDILEPVAAGLEVWETLYQQALPAEAGRDGAVGATPHPVRRFIEGAAARPYLAAVGPARSEAFLSAYDAALDAAYPRRADGSAVFAFRRLFFVAVAP